MSAAKVEETPTKGVKSEFDDMSLEGNDDTPGAPATPSKTPKRGRKKADGGADGETPTKKKRATPAKATGGKSLKVGARPMPTSWDNASPEDRMMLRMKDEEGKGWAEIREAWNAMTGESVGGSTLSGRYGRIKANFVVFRKEDEAHLLKAKKEIEDKFETDKWHRIADAIEGAGGNKYPPAAVQKKFKELQKNGGATETGVKDESDEA
ncbi:hypothetical protein FQN54_005246 [Arachnomyces sp. PD_36]|nr:hypothetical protein FQN54_005246 [Arachnomyces sp. PD_36]